MKLLLGDALEQLKTLPDESVHCCVTSPPYWGLRDYGVAGQLGLEKTPEEYVEKMVEIFREVKRVLRKDGTLWLNLGDSYTNNSQPGGGDPTIRKRNIGETNYSPTIVNGLKPKNLIGIPWRVAFALQADGWYLRSDIIWAKPNPMPESVTDRPTKSHEYIFLLSKAQKYYFDNEAVKEPCVYIENGDRKARAKTEHKRMPDEQVNGIRPYSEPKRFKGSKFNIGKTAIHQLSRSSDKPRVHGNIPGRDDNGAACNVPGQELRNIRSVWTVSTFPYPEAHFATFPEKLIEPCIKAGSPRGGVVLDCFMGSGTTGVMCEKLWREFIGIELNQKYIEMAEKRIYNVQPLFNKGIA